jgi:hypothetical protein
MFRSTNTNQSEKIVPASRSRGMWHKVKVTATISTIFGLASLNLATLTNDSAHSAAFGGLEQMLGYLGHLGAGKVADSLLSHSPTKVRQNDIAQKTSQLSARTSHLQQSVDILDGINKRTSFEKSELQGKHNQLSADHDELLTKHKKLSINYDDLNDIHGKLSTEHTNLNRVSAARSAAAQRATSRIAPRLATTAARAVATLPARAAPFVGTAIVVTVTTWEITEMCETLKDLNEMNATFGHPAIDQSSICGLQFKIPNIY